MSRVIQLIMKEFTDYDEEVELFAECLVIPWPEKSIVDRILEQVEAK